MQRAVGIVRVSQVSGREGESFASPIEQRERIEAACERDGLELVEVVEELDVSGGTPIAERKGLRSAIEAVEAGRVQVIVAAYFDRLVRSLSVQEELVSRVEVAGGRVMAVDIGAVSGASAGQWLTGTFLGAVAEYQRRTTRERTAGAQARAIARGVPTFANIPPGYRRGPDGVLVVDEVAPIVVEAFQIRASGGTINEVRAHLQANGIERTHSAVTKMLRSRVYLGEIRFGELVNAEAHLGIVSPEVFAAVQRVRVPRGPRPKSPLLLARLGVLLCGNCGRKLVPGQARKWPFYRCPPVGDCSRRVTVSASIADRVVVEAVQAVYRDARGRASAERDAREAVARAEQTQADLDAGIRAFSGLADEPAAAERLGELREIRDQAVAQAQHLGGFSIAKEVSLADWGRMNVDQRRRLIQASGINAVVAPGRGARRISLYVHGQPLAGDLI